MGRTPVAATDAMRAGRHLLAPIRHHRPRVIAVAGSGSLVILVAGLSPATWVRSAAIDLPIPGRIVNRRMLCLPSGPLPAHDARTQVVLRSRRRDGDASSVLHDGPEAESSPSQVSPQAAHLPPTTLAYSHVAAD